jgi:hypothetical protein
MTAVQPAVRPISGAFAEALDDCHDRADRGNLVAAAGGWVVASTARVAAGTPVAGSSGLLSVVRRATPSTEDAREAFADGLVRLQRRAVHEVLDAAVARLDHRVAEGVSLLNRQLVRGAVADVALALSEADGLLDLPAGARRRWRVHQDLVAAGRVALGLYGAHSFVAAGPGRSLYLIELLGNTYLHPGGRTGEAGDD